MYPDLLSIGPLTIHTYGLLVAIGFLGAFALTSWLARAYSLGYQQVMDMGFAGLVWGIIGSRLLFVLIHPSHFRAHPLEIFKIWEGGLVFSGGLLAVAGAMFWYSRRSRIPFRTIGDLWAPGVALGQATGRIGCFMAGCCYGKPLDGPWSVVFTRPDSLAPLNIPLHPTQIYSALSGFLISGILVMLHKRKRFEGQVLLWFFILHSTSRLMVERFRGDQRGLIPGTEMSVTQLFALLLLVGSVAALLMFDKSGIRSTKSEAITDDRISK
jgi:phosphatidylglycerol:prolipoprotein diacylglycerol transferase